MIVFEFKGIGRSWHTLGLERSFLPYVGIIPHKTSMISTCFTKHFFLFVRFLEMARFVLNEIPLILIQSTYQKEVGYFLSKYAKFRREREKKKEHLSMIVQKSKTVCTGQCQDMSVKLEGEIPRCSAYTISISHSEPLLSSFGALYVTCKPSCRSGPLKLSGISGGGSHTVRMCSRCENDWLNRPAAAF